MGTVLALVARFGHAGLAEFEQHFQDKATQHLRDRVEMVLDVEVERAYPQRWIGKVTVYTTDGRVLSGRVDEPKGDPGNTLSRDEIAAKALASGAHAVIIDLEDAVAPGDKPAARGQLADAFGQFAAPERGRCAGGRPAGAAAGVWQPRFSGRPGPGLRTR